MSQISLKELQGLSLSDLEKKLGMNNSTAKIIKDAAKDYETISNNSLTNQEIARRLGKSKHMVDIQRSLLIKYGFIDQKNDKSIITGKIKIMGYVPSGGRTVYFNRGDMRASSLDPEKEYFVLVESFSEKESKGFIVRVFNTRNDALSYNPKSK